MVEKIIGQTLGVIATLVTFLSYQTNTKKAVLTVQSIATACTCLSYFFLGASSGFALNIVCLIRNVLFYFEKENTLWCYLTASGLALIMIGLGILSWQGYVSLFIIVALAANTVFLSFGNPQLLRKSILFTSTAILIYNVFVFSIGGIANESLAIISSIIGIIRFKGAKNNETQSKTTC